MVGVSSAKQHLERLRIGFSQAVSAVSRAVEWGGNVVTGVQATPEGGARAARKADRARSLPRQTRVGATSIHASVQRWAGHTQAYVLELEHTVTLQVVDEQEPRSAITERGEALVRMAEPDAYRYGLPVDEAAVGRDHRGAVRLRDDPDPGRPPGRRKSLPRWLGPDGLRGAGPATVRNLTGADEARAEVIARLQELGWVPALDGTGFPILSSDRMEAKSQLQNLAEVTERLSTAGLETGYDQARQDGMIVDLVLERSAGHPCTGRCGSGWSRPDPATTAATWRPRSRSTCTSPPSAWGRSQSQSFQRSRTVDAGTENVYDPLDAGLASERAAAAVGRGPVRTATSSVDDNVSQVGLVESAGPVAVFAVPHQLTVEEFRQGGWHPLVADRPGSAEVLLPADLLDARGPAEPETRQEVTDAFARYLTPRLVRARWLHADLGPVLDTILAALPRTGEAALAHVARFADVLSVVAHPELAVLPYETVVEVLGRSLRPVSASVSLRVPAAGADLGRRHRPGDRPHQHDPGRLRPVPGPAAGAQRLVDRRDRRAGRHRDGLRLGSARGPRAGRRPRTAWSCWPSTPDSSTPTCCRSTRC